MKKHIYSLIILLTFILLVSCNCFAETELSLQQEEIMLDQNDIVITATGINEVVMGSEVSLLLNIDNNSDEEIMVYATRTSVNGIMLDGVIAKKVSPHTSSKGSISFMSFLLEDAGINQIAEIETSIHIVGDTMDFESDVVCIKTSLYGTFTQTYDDDDDILLEESGIKIVKKELTVDDYISGQDFYVENNSDKPLLIKAVDNVVNGTTMDSTLTFPIVEIGKKAVYKVSFMNADLTKAGISSIKSLSSHFIFMDSVTQEVIFERDLSFEENATVGVISAPALLEGNAYADEIIEVSVSNLKIDNMGESTMDISIKNVGSEKVTYSTGKVRVNGMEISGYTGAIGNPDFLEEIPAGAKFDTVLRMHRNGFAEQKITEITSLELEMSFIMESLAIHDITLNVPFNNSEASATVAGDITKDANDYVVNTYFIRGSNRTSVIYELTNPNDADVSLKGTIKFKNANGDVIGTQDDSLHYISPDCFNVMIFDTTETIDSVSLSLTPTVFTGEKASYTVNNDDSVDKELRVSVTNIGDREAIDTEVSVLFGNGGKVIGYSRGLNGKKMINLGAHETGENYITNMPYDNYLVYVSGVYE